MTGAGIDAAAWSLLQQLGGIDPSPFFVLSLLPYLAFLWWAGRVRAFPRLALRGFQLTLLFVAVTIAAAIAAEILVGRQLADVDLLHGGAEAFLTLSNLLVVLGFAAAGRDPAPAAGSRADGSRADGSRADGSKAEGSTAAGRKAEADAADPAAPD